MQPASDLLSQEESASLARVTQETLRKYVAHGLLDFITDDNGKECLSREELSEIFQIDENHQQSESDFSSDLFSGKLSRELEEKIILGESSLGVAGSTHSAPTPKKAKASFTAQGPIPLSKSGQSIDSDGSLELIEINAHLRERLKSLKAERNWLRERVEKLELQLEREQTLLMAESETVRRLISLNANSRKAGIASTVKRLLGWERSS